MRRDLRILQFLFEHKVASRDQIHYHFFSDASRRAVNRRLKKILDLGLIRRMPVEAENGLIFSYLVTQKGMDKVMSILPYGTDNNGTQSYCPLHDMTLVDIRRAFEAQDSVQEYYTENVLQRSYDFKENHPFRPFVELHSDGVISIDAKTGILNLAVEFEAHKKTIERYRKKLDDYYLKRKVKGVLYICSDESILNTLSKTDKEVFTRHSRSSKMYLALLKDVIQSNKGMTFRNAENFIIKIR